ncbi:DUF3742 family protein [Pseudomonas sp. S3_E10]
MGQYRQNSASMRLGTWLGRLCRDYLLFERRVLQLLGEKGLPRWLIKACGWVMTLSVLGIFLYMTFWIAVICFAVTLAVRWVLKAGFDSYEVRPEWKNGLSGYGLYRGGIRIDPGSPDD